MERIDINGLTLDQHHYFLLDPSQVEADAASPWQALPKRALAPPGFEAQASQLPGLLAWHDLDSAQRVHVTDLLTHREAADAVEAASMCVALLQTGAQPAVLRRHLRQLLVPHFPGGGRGVFRFHDPVVFVHLDWMLTASERKVLFGPISVWAVAWRGEWLAQTMQTPGEQHVLFAPGAPAWKRIGRIGAIHAVLETEALWRAQPARYGPQVEPWLHKAEAHGLVERDDVVAFVRHGLLKHPRFDTHPEVLAMLQQCAEHPTRYRRFTSLWSDAHWQGIVRDLDRSGEARPEVPIRADHPMQGAN